MKLTIELEDFEYLCDNYDEYDNPVFTKDDLAHSVLENIKDGVVCSINRDHGTRYEIINSCIEKILAEHKDEIISSVVKELTESVSKKKAIMDQTPKRKDFQNINKEWEEYFEGLIDKCIAKKFK